MKIILLGPPGVGKGTVAKGLTQYDNSVQISTGDILRKAVKDDTELGKQAKAYMDKGDLVPDSLIMGIMEDRLQEPDCKNGFLLDGFPRTIPQAEALKELLTKLNITLDFVVNLEVSKEIILNRLLSRRTCSNQKCQAIYSIKSPELFPNPDGTCKKCGSPTIQRDDETEETILFRLETYDQKTSPLIEYYKNEGLIKNVPSVSSKEAVDDIIKLYENK